MTPDQQRQKIAVIFKPTGLRRAVIFEGEPEQWLWATGAVTGPPDEDLNGAFQMELHTALDEYLYSKWLWVVVTDTPIPTQDPWDVVRNNQFPQFDLYAVAPFRSATAAQRAKAFLLTFDPYSFHPAGDTHTPQCPTK